VGYKVSDFLGNLAAKSLKLMPVVRPRPVSFFEPVRAEGALGREQALDAFSAFDQPEADGAPALPQPLIRPRSADPFAVQPPPASTPDSGEGAPRPPVWAARPVQARPFPGADAGAWPPETEARARRLAGPPSSRQPRPAASYAAAASQAPAQAPFEESRLAPMDAPVPPAGARESASDDARRQPASAPAKEPIAVERRAGGDMPRLTPASLTTPPRLTTATDIRPLPPGEPAPTPTIQVTIGRIEVRATPAAAPPARKERSAPQVMSLDDYLHQRNQGGGR
jgi:hypothetical protein